MIRNKAATTEKRVTFLTEKFCFFFRVLATVVAGAQDILDIKQIVDVKGSLEPQDSVHREWSDLATLWTWETLFLSPPTYQTLQALLAKHVETLEQPRLFVGLQTYPTGDLVLDLLESFLGSSGGFGSHGSVSSAADKLERGSSQD